MVTFTAEINSMSENKSGPRKTVSVRLIADIAMGIIYLGLGIWILMFKRFGNFKIDGPLAWLFSGLIIFYGAFRLYRGRADMRNNRYDQ